MKHIEAKLTRESYLKFEEVIALLESYTAEQQAAIQTQLDMYTSVIRLLTKARLSVEIEYTYTVDGIVKQFDKQIMERRSGCVLMILYAVISESGAVGIKELFLGLE